MVENNSPVIGTRENIEVVERINYNGLTLEIIEYTKF